MAKQMRLKNAKAGLMVTGFALSSVVASMACAQEYPVSTNSERLFAESGNVMSDNMPKYLQNLELVKRYLLTEKQMLLETAEVEELLHESPELLREAIAYWVVTVDLDPVTVSLGGAGRTRLGSDFLFGGRALSTDIVSYLGFNSAATTYGLYGSATSAETKFNYGVYGTTNQLDGFGVYAENSKEDGFLVPGRGSALFATGNINAFNNSNGSAHSTSHVAVIENKGNGRTNVLALTMPNEDSAAFSDRFISFIAGDSNGGEALLGIIQANEAGGVIYTSVSADVAEWLERQQVSEQISAGDIVAVVKGKVSKNTDNFEHIQVISSAPIVLGNDPGDEQRSAYEKVAFLGQVPARVSGVVDSGDYIVASGKNDGAGIAISAENMTPENYRMMVGRAWESSLEPGMKLVNVAVGLGANEAYTYMRKQDQRIASLEHQLSDKMAQLDRLAASMEILSQKVAYIQSSNGLVTAVAK